jgi:hypothetical protein
MFNTLAQAKSINEKAALSAARRRAWLFYEKATRKAARRVPSVTPTCSGTPELPPLDRIRDPIEFCNQPLRQPTHWLIELTGFFCHTYCGIFLLYASFILFYYFGIYLFNQSQ